MDSLFRELCNGTVQALAKHAVWRNEDLGEEHEVEEGVVMNRHAAVPVYVEEESDKFCKLGLDLWRILPSNLLLNLAL